MVTGASRGLGRATAEALLAEGAKLVVVARGADELEAFAALHPGRCVAVAGDLRDTAVPQRAVDAALAAFGALHLLVANTGGPPPVQPLDATDADFAAAFDTAFHPAVRLIKAAAVPMRAQGRGRIVIVSSTSVRAPKPFLALSAAARSALWAWARAAAPSLLEDGITVNAVFAGPHDTARARELGASGRPMGDARDFAAIATFLCGDAMRFTTGSGLTVDGGELRGL